MQHHAPHTDGGSDERNYHAHIMFTTRAIDLRQVIFQQKYRDFSRDSGTKRSATGESLLRISPISI